MTAPLVIAVDFDGVICAEAFPKIGAPCLPIVLSLKRVRAAGHRLVLNTCREGELLSDAVRFCESLGLSFDAVNENLPERTALYGRDCRKIGADLYIDDKTPGYSVEGTVWHLLGLCGDDA